MLTRKHLWLPAMAAAILTAGLVMPTARSAGAQDLVERRKNVKSPPAQNKANARTKGNERGIVIWMRPTAPPSGPLNGPRNPTTRPR
jgi:hypothetical protein